MSGAAAKGKAPAANGAAKGGTKGGAASSKAESSSATASGAATPTDSGAPLNLSGAPPNLKDASGRLERPDKKKYEEEQAAVKAKIDEKQAQKAKLEEQLTALTSGAAGNEKQKVLREELNTLKNSRSTSRTKIFEQINTKKAALDTKKKELQASKSKSQFQNVQDLDAHVKHLDKQVESGNMKLADEKRALQEIIACKRSRKTVEALQAKQDALAQDQAEIDALRKQLDDPELQAAHDRVDAITTELDVLRKAGDEYYGTLNKLRDQRTALKAELDTLFKEKRDSSQAYKDAGDRYYAKVKADRERRQEQFKAQRKAEEDARRLEVAMQIREQAEIPAYQEEVEDCQTLIDFFSGKGSGVKERPDAASVKVALVGVPELELRQVDTAPAKGFVEFKRKHEGEAVYFAGKGKGKGKKGGNKVKPNGAANANSNGDAPAPPHTPSPSDKLQIPIGTLRALLKMSIPPPSSSADVSRTVEDLKTKKAWFEANQARVTKDNIARAEAQIKKLDAAAAAAAESTVSSKGNSGTATPVSELLPPNGSGENPAEPIPTPLKTDTLSIGVESEKVDEVLESVQEEVAAES